MTVTDQFKILGRKMMQNKAQYDLGRKAAKISTLSSNNLDKYEYLVKYEYLTGEDLGLKPSTVEQAKFEYSSLSKVFIKGLDKEENNKEGLFKRLKNIKSKNGELLNAYSGAKKVSKAAKNESNYNYDSKYTFYKFFRDFKKFFKLSLGSKYDEMNDFYTLLNAFINTHEATTTETKDCKNRILSYVKPLSNEYMDAYKKNYDIKELTDEDKRKYDYKSFEIIDKKEQTERTGEKTKTEMQKPLWFEINRKYFEELTRDIYNNQDNNDFKFTINRRTYSLRNAKKIWTKVTTCKTTKSEAKELYNELIQKYIDTLEKSKSNKPEKHNILNIFENVGTIFTGAYLHCKDVLKEAMFERSIAEKIKLREGRFDEIKSKKQNINNELFKEYFNDYQSPSNMYKKISETENAEINKSKVDFIKKILGKLQKTIDYVLKDKTYKIEGNEKIIDIVKRILDFNAKIQLGQGLKISTPNQMLSRLPITLAQLNAGKNSEKLKNEIRQLLHSLYRSKKLTK